MIGSKKDGQMSRDTSIDMSERKFRARHKRSDSVDIVREDLSLGRESDILPSPSQSPVNLDATVPQKIIDLDRVTEESEKFQTYLEASYAYSQATLKDTRGELEDAFPRYFDLSEKMDSLNPDFFLSPCSYMAENSSRGTLVQIDQDSQNVTEDGETWESEGSNDFSNSYYIFRQTCSLPKSVLEEFTRRLELALTKKRRGT